MMPPATKSPSARVGSRVGPSYGRVLLLMYYLGVLLALVVLYGRGDFSTSGFIYQAF